jgi:hypothetical protein
MAFEHEVHEQTFDKLKEYLGELFEEPYHDPENDHFYVRYGTTVLEISVDAYGDEEAVVAIMSYCAQDVEVEEELLLGLLELNHQMSLGAFSLVGRDVFFAYSMFGRNLEPRDLLRAITVVATVADEYDDRIVERYGGQTALERIQDTGGRRKRIGDELGRDDFSRDDSGRGDSDEMGIEDDDN